VPYVSCLARSSGPKYRIECPAADLHWVPEHREGNYRQSHEGGAALLVAGKHTQSSHGLTSDPYSQRCLSMPRKTSSICLLSTRRCGHGYNRLMPFKYKRRRQKSKEAAGALRMTLVNQIPGGTSQRTLSALLAQLLQTISQSFLIVDSPLVTMAPTATGYQPNRRGLSGKQTCHLPPHGSSSAQVSLNRLNYVKDMLI